MLTSSFRMLLQNPTLNLLSIHLLQDVLPCLSMTSSDWSTPLPPTLWLSRQRRRLGRRSTSKSQLATHGAFSRSPPSTWPSTWSAVDEMWWTYHGRHMNSQTRYCWPPGCRRRWDRVQVRDQAWRLGLWWRYRRVTRRPRHGRSDVTLAGRERYETSLNSNLINITIGYMMGVCPGHDVKLHPHFIVTGSFLYWCVMRPASQRFFIHNCINLRNLIISN